MPLCMSQVHWKQNVNKRSETPNCSHGTVQSRKPDWCQVFIVHFPPIVLKLQNDLACKCLLVKMQLNINGTLQTAGL